jgi:hypothetical protein
MQPASHPIENIQASGALRLRAPQRAALLAAAGGQLRRVGRAWTGNGTPVPISTAVVDDLVLRGLLSGGTIYASLTAIGKWYASTLARHLALEPQPNDEALG